MKLLIVAMLTLLTVVRAQEMGGRKFKPYDILGVHRSSSAQQIKKSYKRLVKELHPDRNHAPDANDRLV